MKSAIFSLGLFALVSSGTAAEKISSALTLPYQQFDQTPRMGWRSLAEKKQFRAAASLIEAYLAKHSELDRFQRVNLHWHAAQALAMDGDTEAALKHLPFARLDPEPTSGPVSWNDYVAATEAFLLRDRAKLLAAKERMAKNHPDDPNLPIVASLLVHFDKPYATAYKTE